MQLGFVIDHTRCIGCHACTVACKAENDVPLGNFRTWVKYTEEGEFPAVRRSFAVLRCNQCTDAPCVEICPVRALEKRSDGIVDIDPAVCIGCKACMQGCPYDALHINESRGTVEKCHFCAHRTERGLAPACAVVCPTEAIVPGDFHDPGSVVSRLRKENDLQRRKPEAGTGPNVLYREVSDSGIDPLQTAVNGGYLWSDRASGLIPDVGELEQAEARARTTYNVDHAALWGWKVSAYLFTKSLAAGIFLVLPLLLSTWVVPQAPSRSLVAGLSVCSLLFLLVTLLLLVADLKRPERFLYILLRPNWRSWLVRGSVVLGLFGALQAVWLGLLLGDFLSSAGVVILLSFGVLFGGLTAAYTGWLFGQARGRVLWMRRGLWFHLLVQALVAGAAFALIARLWLNASDPAAQAMRWVLIGGLVLHGLMTVSEARCSPRGREAEFARAVRQIHRGRFSRAHLGLGIGAGMLIPLMLLVSGSGVGAAAAAGVLALLGLYVEENIMVRAGQALPIS